jgi:maltose alpha-D-glucosyltransferase/alpha-amylase
MARRLAAAGFANTPPYLGRIVRARDGNESTLALLQGFVRNQGDGWTWSQDYLERAVYDHPDNGAEAANVDDTVDAYGTFAATIGRRLGELHTALAQPSDDPDFQPEPATEMHVSRWVDAALAELDGAFAQLASFTQWPDDDARAEAERVLSRRELVHERVRSLATGATGTLLTAIHGDFHLGQVLVSSGDVFIVDLEGEPARALGARDAKSSPLKDLAGILRSLDYASTAANVDGRGSMAREDRTRLLERLRERASAAVTVAYAAATGRSPGDFDPRGSLGPLLRLFLLEKAAYEVRYEIANRPGWVATPVRGLARLTAELLQRDA